MTYDFAIAEGHKVGPLTRDMALKGWSVHSIGAYGNRSFYILFEKKSDR